ncbi:Ribosomal protein L18ae/LX family protein, partial [Prunus dulcis]
NDRLLRTKLGWAGWGAAMECMASVFGIPLGRKFPFGLAPYESRRSFGLHLISSHLLIRWFSHLSSSVQRSSERFSICKFFHLFSSGFEHEEKEQHRMLTDFEGAARKNEVGFRIWTSKEFHQYQVVGRKLPTASDEHPKIYRMKLWATNERKKVKKSNGQVLAIDESMFFAVGKWFLLNSSPGEIQFVAKGLHL